MYYNYNSARFYLECEIISWQKKFDRFVQKCQEFFKVKIAIVTLFDAIIETPTSIFATVSFNLGKTYLLFKYFIYKRNIYWLMATLEC